MKGREAWHAAVHEIRKSCTQLSDWKTMTKQRNIWYDMIYMMSGGGSDQMKQKVSWAHSEWWSHQESFSQETNEVWRELEGGERINTWCKWENRNQGRRQQRPKAPRQDCAFWERPSAGGQWAGAERINYRGSDDDGLCCCLVAKSRLTLWDPMACSTPGFCDGLRGQQSTLGFLPSEVGNPRRIWNRV